MSALSYYDIINELGKNILIYPLNCIKVQNASIDLTASKHAWSINSKKSLLKDDKIVIPPGESAIIFTNETIHISHKICGTFHSKVTLVAEGLSGISTTLDPLFTGILSITTTNNSDKEISLAVDSPFVTLMLNYIKHSSSSLNAITSKEFITSLNAYEGYQAFYNYVQSQNWIFKTKELREKVINSSEYKEFKSLLKYRDKVKSFISNPIVLPIFSLLILLLPLLIFYIFCDMSMMVYIVVPLLGYIIAEIFKYWVNK